ncbi:FAD-binding protein [Phenylobacterium sp.]|uniref:FAD-dependent oxidoreductase n=1 Tax=Phenylobacterium sp. TaxID=1871053 RepID=UPI002F427505
MSKAVGGRLTKVEPPFAVCAKDPDGAACAELFKNLRNPFFIGESVALTQTLGWTDAWTSKPSEYAVAAETSADVAAAVKFASKHNLRLVVKGGGHSYLGGSNAPDSLLIWTKPMRAVEVHQAFTPQGCAGRVAPQPAVSVGAGAIWLDAYEAVTTKAGRYVQGGGCTTVGVAGLVQGGGFGSFSKGFGTGAAGLLEAEIVTADGVVRVANACTNPDLFWALKGGGGGTFGVVTRLTLLTHDLPPFFGAVNADITASSDAAYRALVEQLLTFYRTSLMNPHWGEQIRFSPKRRLSISMVFQGLDQAGAQATWRPFFDWVSARAADYTLSKPQVLAIPAKLFWNGALLKAVPGVVRSDNRPGGRNENFFWEGDAGQVGQVVHTYQSTWLSQQLLEPARQPALVDALIHAGDGWSVSLHCNKGLAGAPAEALARTRETAMNPAVLDAFALAITGGEEPPAYPGIKGHEPNDGGGRIAAKVVRAAWAPLSALPAKPASYLSETDYFEADWQAAFWGDHYPRLKEIKRRYDPDGLFFVHHSVGSETWSPDGFARTG